MTSSHTNRQHNTESNHSTKTHQRIAGSHGNTSKQAGHHGNLSNSHGNVSPRTHGNVSPLARAVLHSNSSPGTSHSRVSRSSANGGPDSGYGFEEEGSESSDVFHRPVSQASSSFECWSSFSSDVDPSLETSLNESGLSSALEDSTEREYFNEMKKIHQQNSLVKYRDQL